MLTACRDIGNNVALEEYIIFIYIDLILRFHGVQMDGRPLHYTTDLLLKSGSALT